MRLIHSLVAVLLCSLVVLGQTNRGGITGTVVDANGAAVVGATVTITNIGTNAVIKLTTSEAGVFNATSLEPVNYRILVEAQGFKKSILNNVKVDTASTAGTANIALATGGITEEVTVTAEATTPEHRKPAPAVARSPSAR